MLRLPPIAFKSRKKQPETGAKIIFSIFSESLRLFSFNLLLQSQMQLTVI